METKLLTIALFALLIAPCANALVGHYSSAIIDTIPITKVAPVVLRNDTDTTTMFKIGIGTSAPTAPLHVNGAVRFQSLVCTSLANGGKLTTDANGNVICSNDISTTGGAATNESDPQVSILINGNLCTSDGTAVNCNKASVAWSEISGKPQGFADGIDDTGTGGTETDPTITDARIKDGVAWTELSGIPSGFADGIDDNSGTGTETDPQVGTLTNGRMCTSDGTAVNCNKATVAWTELSGIPTDIADGDDVGTGGTVGDDLGDHTADMNIKLNNKWLSNDGTNKGVYITSAGNVGVGTSLPTAMLEVAGQIKITGGSPGANKVLTSDANGLATWQNMQVLGETDPQVGTLVSGNLCTSDGAAVNCNKASVAWSEITGKPTGFADNVDDVGTGGTADNLGNHIATQNIQLNNKWLSNDGGNEGIYVNSAGSVGIGTSNPQGNFHVEGQATITSNLLLSSYKCAGAANGGKLSTDAYGLVRCAPDVGIATETDPTVPAGAKDGFQVSLTGCSSVTGTGSVSCPTPKVLTSTSISISYDYYGNLVLTVSGLCCSISVT